MPSKNNRSLFVNSLLMALALLAGYGLTLHFDNGRPPNVQKIEAAPLPGFSFTDIGGTTHQSADFRGKVVLINFWATWCAPCVVEFPHLLDIAAKNPDIVLVALSSDGNDDAIQTFLQKQKKPSANVLIARDAEDATLKIFGVSRLPETLVVGPDLTLREKLVGADWEPAMLQKIIDSLRR